MLGNNKHLTLDDRYKILIDIDAKKTFKEIANELKERLSLIYW